MAIQILCGRTTKQPDECLKTLMQAIDCLDMEDVLNDPLPGFVVQDVMRQTMLIGKLTLDRIAV